MAESPVALAAQAAYNALGEQNFNTETSRAKVGFFHKLISGSSRNDRRCANFDAWLSTKADTCRLAKQAYDNRDQTLGLLADYAEDRLILPAKRDEMRTYFAYWIDYLTTQAPYAPPPAPLQRLALRT